MCLNDSKYESFTGIKFEFNCNTDWPGALSPNDLFLNYTHDFISCVNSCAIWNQNPILVKGGRCLGIAWADGNFGPLGEAGGSQCYLKWTLQGPGKYSTYIHSARLMDEVPIVSPTCK